jgi:urease accessory protein
MTVLTSAGGFPPGAAAARGGGFPGSAAALMLADARLPAGGHAHSGGVEAAVTAGTVSSLPSLEAFLLGRLATAGVVAAGLAAAACARARDRPAPWRRLDGEADARTPSPAQREASRRQGRALLRCSLVAWPAPWLDDLGRSREGPHHPVVLGAAAAAAGCDPSSAALAAAYLSVSGPASAAVRLLALDPLAVSGVLAGMACQIETAAGHAAAAGPEPPGELPFPSGPALDLLAEAHARAEVRLFAS